ncbi:hypothetical protein [Bathymodiolus platifrons methanotrophic gill symbiont]|uniref:hypothetical protein n=1 Tax=Bathymodiolus platifrons methanotrophic gill symbiont TaxID=113268 RepID=UPI001C8D9B82|nr:hypothetical protein [Bathymodiolus platifrons methanotrophic gill symbiont]
MQHALNTHQIIHKFVHSHWTAGKVPAVALGVLEKPLFLESILNSRFAQESAVKKLGISELIDE